MNPLASTTYSRFLTLRHAAAALLCLAAISFAVLSFATPTPAGDVLSTSHRMITYTDSTGAPANPSPIATGVPQCGPTNALCSVFNLTIDPSIGLAVAGYDPNQYQIAIQWQWGVSTVDYDWFVEDAAGHVIAKNQSTADPSSVILPTTTTPGIYKLIGTLSTGAPIPYTGTVTLQAKPQVSGVCAANDPSCKPPRYQNYPAGTGQADNAGEPSLGVDWNPNLGTLKHDQVNTGGVAFFTSGSNEWRVNFDDCASPAIYNWEDVSAVFTQTFVLSDPIGFVDHYSSQQLGLSYPPPHTPGRVFSLDLIGGQGDSLGSYSDDDGTSYLPGGNGGPGAGPDHETLGGGPYASPIPPNKTGSYPNAIYYCSQNIVAEAQCSRSDDGGQTFGPGVPIFTPSQCTGGIHGHVKVARDGTVYVPNSSCGTIGTAGVAVSTDNGLTWTENNVVNSTSSQDPSVGTGQNDVGRPAGQTTPTVYLGYVDGNGHAYVSRSGDRGANWSTPVDVGAPFGVTHAVFPTVVTGDDNRAAFAFIGTGNGISTNNATCDPYGATLNCANLWHLYVATTYDGGGTWVTVDATPDDPVQTGTVCLQGTTCAGGRNLLDFMDFAIDSQGRGLVGFADGCVNCSNAFSTQSDASHGTVTRQSGGRRLFAAFDPIEPSVPAAPQLVSAVLQPTGGAVITWLEPDNGGSPITSYRIYRGTTSGTETFLASVSGNTTTKYLDSLTPPPGPPGTNVFYYVTAVNAQGEGTHCREVSLVPPTTGGGNTCDYPYVNMDPAGTPGAIPDTTGEQTIQYVNVGEPFTTCADNSLTFIMKVPTLDPGNTGTAVLPQNTEYQVLFNVKDTAGNPETIYVEMDTNCPATPANPAFSYGRRDASATGGSFDQGECTNQSPTSSCPKITGSYNKDGTILIKLDVSTPLSFSANTGAATGTGGAFTWDGHAPGTKLGAVTGEIVVFAGCGAGFLETASSSSGGTYTRKGNASCQNTPPVAALSAMPVAGRAPLDVTFTASGTEPAGACGVINSYTLDFGDGTPPVTQATAEFHHTYTSDGEFPARLTVSDTAGQTSTNEAQVIISVTSTTPNVTGVVSRKAHTNVGNFDVVLPLGGTPATEPRSGGAQGNHTIIIGFQNGLNSVGSVTASAQTQSGTQPVTITSNAIGVDPHQYVVNLTGVPNASLVTVTLSNVTDSTAATGNVSIQMGVLIGDANNDGTVNSADATMTRNVSGHLADSSNYRNDANLDGVNNSADATIVRNHSGTTIHFTNAAAKRSSAKVPATSSGAATATINGN